MTTGFNFSSTKTRLIWSIFIAAIFINTAYNRFGMNNQMEPLPMIYRAMDPHYLVNDWFTNTNDRLNHRTGFITLVVTISRFVGLENTYALLTWIGVWLMIWAIFELRSVVWEEELPPPYQSLEYLFAVGLALKLTWGTIGLPGGLAISLDPSLLGIPLAIFATVFLLRKNFWASGTTFLIAGIVHPLAAPQILLLALIAWWFQLSKSQRREKWWVAPTLLLAGVLPVLTLLSFTLSKETSPEQAQRATEILVLIRAPHHYAPFTWPLSSWLQFAASLVFIGLVCTQTGPSRFLYGLVIVTVLFALSGCLPFLLGTHLELAKLETFRSTTLIPLLLALAFGRYLAMLASNKAGDGALAAALGGALLLNRYMTFAPPVYRNFLMTPVVWTVAFAAFLAIRKYLPQSPKALQWLVLCPWWLAYWYANVRTSPKIYVVFVAVLVLYALLINTKPWIAKLPRGIVQGILLGSSVLLLCLYAAETHLVSSGQNDAPTEAPLYAWVRSHSPEQAVFMTPPDLQRFRLGAHRAVVVDSKCIPFRDIAILQWQDRMTSLDVALKSYPPDPAPWRTLAHRFGADYIVLPTTKPIKLTPVYRDANYSVYPVNS